MSIYFNWPTSLRRFIRFDSARANDMNAALDELTTGLSSLEGDVNRALKLPIGTADQTLALAPGVRANKVVSFDASGNLTASAFDVDSAGINAAAAVVARDAAQASAVASADSAVASAASAAASTAAQTALFVVVGSGTSQTASAGTHHVLTSASAVTLTLPLSPASGATVWATFTNGLATNVIARNGQTIMGFAEDLDINNTRGVTVRLRFVGSSWRLV